MELCGISPNLPLISSPVDLPKRCLVYIAPVAKSWAVSDDCLGCLFLDLSQSFNDVGHLPFEAGDGMTIFDGGPAHDLGVGSDFPLGQATDLIVEGGHDVGHTRLLKTNPIPPVSIITDLAGISNGCRL